MVGGKSTFYKYDENGNIIQISEGAAGAEGKTSTFKYDKRNQLIREDNHLLNKTFTYAYDLGGNMTRMEEYAFTKADKALPSTPVKTVRGTFDGTWKDQLLTWNGVSMTYDAIGNMVKKGNTTYTWTQGRKLSTVNNGKKSQYFYDHTGRRVRKTVDGVTTDFRMAGELLMSQKAGDVTTYFSYDSAGNLIGMSAGSNRYFYTRNAQNDITGLIDENGTSVVQYQYDSWGKLLGITGSLASTIGKRNPFRYRGYYYDDETGMYYLQSRYYDPEIKRFICADKVVYSSWGGANLYLYCESDPINKVDYNGCAATSITAGLIGLVGAALAGLNNIFNNVIDNVRDSINNLVNQFSNSISDWGTGYNSWNIAQDTLQEQAKLQIDQSFAKAMVIPVYRRSTEKHHIVARKDKRAKIARKILSDAGMTVENPNNWVWLKTGLHRRLHNENYYLWINAEMMEVAIQSFPGKPSKEKITGKLDEISEVLKGWSNVSPF